jgi:hypothetical protein
MVALVPDNILFSTKSAYPYANYLADVEAVFETKADILLNSTIDFVFSNTLEFYNV